MSATLRVFASTPPAFPSSRFVLAACAAGHTGVLSLEYVKTDEDAAEALAGLYRSDENFAVALGKNDERFSALLDRAVRCGLDEVIIFAGSDAKLSERVARLKQRSLRVVVEVTNISDALASQAAGADALVVKGNESWGAVGEETAFILLQRLMPVISVPVYVRGGIGLHSAGACLAAGAAGVVLDWQLSLCQESEVPEPIKARIARMDGSETAILGQECGLLFRAYSRPGELAYAELRQKEERDALHPKSETSAFCEWEQAIEEKASQQSLLLIGQDACFAADLASQFKTVKQICDAIRTAAVRNCSVAASANVLRENGPLAQLHNTRFAIAQGPMTRVSDKADFALAVAEGGGLPFLALALMRGPEVGRVLEETEAKLKGKSWGIGILGFVPRELRDEQMKEAMKYSPPFAVIAGGRPDQAKALEQAGTRTYLHVPSPELLRSFLENGARRVVFEGRECGGHVGPRTSFVLWNSMVKVILSHLKGAGSDTRGEEYSVLFAGGVHDGLSAAMVSALAAPLSERGVKIGVLLGTGYLFTEEAVASGAITPAFQEEAMSCAQTVLLESGVGHATRCADTDFGRDFAQEKRKLLQQGLPKETVRENLEGLNLGRLRIAAKGISRGEATAEGKPTYIQVDAEAQRRDGMFMIGQVAALRDKVCTIEELHQDVSSAGAILEKQMSRLRSQTAAKPCDIAIVGVSCTLPKARDAKEFWQNIWNKVNAIQEVPKERWDTNLYFDSDRRARDKVYSRWGGFIEDTAFDPVEYGMPPNSVPSIEPMQLLTLELVRQALEDAGYDERRFDRERTSAIVGTGGGVGELGLGYGFRSLIPHFVDHAGGTSDDSETLIQKLEGHLPEWTEDSFAGLLLNVVAGRVANRFDLGGTNFIVDAACATSLAALRLAATELESRSSNVVIVAASDMMQTPFGYLCFSKTQALSPTGQCRTFDESADGIVISEGIAVAVLKRLEDAERDGDRIYAVLKSVGASSDGRDKGLTAPRPIGQIRALDRAYQKADIPASTVGLIEAHGTGTVVGDGTEVESLTTYFRDAGADVQTCALGSVKSMVGHTKCTAGFAGLIKASMALHHKVLPPTMGITKPNPKANFPETPFYLNTETRPWFKRSDGAPRRAGVSAFGFGGTNFHVVLEEYNPALPAQEATAPLVDWGAELFLFRGKSGDILQAVDSVTSALAAGSQPALCELAAAVYWEKGQGAGEHCLAVVASSLEDLREKLDKVRPSLQAERSIQDPRGIYYSTTAAEHPKVAFVFPGQGSQRTNMLLDLVLAFPEMRETFEQADLALGDTLGKPLSAFAYPPPSFTEEERSANETALKQTRVAQPALGAANMAVYRLLKQLGVRPDWMGGHSYGEFAALSAAGTLSFDELIRVSESRGRFIVEAAQKEPGTMAALDGDEKRVAAVVSGLDGVCIANLNSPSQTVISGTKTGVEQALKKAASNGLTGRVIPVSCAFHSSLVAGARDRLREALDICDVREPRVPVFSNTTAAPHAGTPDKLRELLSDHLVKPVRFADEVLAMWEAGARIFVESGPGKVLTGLVSQTLSERPHTAIAIDQAGRPGLLQLVHALAQLATAGVRLSAYRLFEGRVRNVSGLASLLEQSRPAPLPRTAWMITAGRALPAHKAPTDKAKEANVPAATTERSDRPRLLASTNQGAASPSVTPQPVQRSVSRTTATAAPSTPGSPVVSPQPAVSVRTNPVVGGEGALRSHHRLMTSFLQTHRNVMMSFLGSGAPAVPAAHTSAVAHSAPVPAVPAAPPQQMAAAAPSLSPAKAPVHNAPVEVAAPAREAGEERVAVTVAVAPAAITRESITAQLISLVSNRTGYPPEMLDLDLDLEADLGVDSIKRVEIFGALQSAEILPGQAIEGEIETLSKLKTLRAIVDWIAAAAEGKAPEQSPAKPVLALPPPEEDLFASNSAVTAAEAPLARMVVEVVDAAVAESASGIDLKGRVVITDDGSGIAPLLLARLKESGIAGEVVPLPLAEGRLDPAATARIIAELRTQKEQVAALVHLYPLANLDSGEAAEFYSRLDTELKSLYSFSRELEPELKRANGCVLVATRLGGAFASAGTDRSSFWPGHGAVCGFVKALGREWPEVACRAIDFSPASSPEQIVSALLNELATRDNVIEAGYVEGKRVTLTSVLRAVPEGKSVLTLQRDSVVLVTGGARGVTAEVAKEIAARFTPTIVLLGRSPLPSDAELAPFSALGDEKSLKNALIQKLQSDGIKPTPAKVEGEYRAIRQQREIRDNLQFMRDAGATVEYHAVDVGDEGKFGGFIDDLYGRFGKIDGVVHGAGVIEDKLLRDKTPESLDRVLRPKIVGAVTLSRKLRPDTLRFLTFFSSVSARYGNRGQCDYAAANETLNKMAISLNAQWPARVTSLNWGPWQSSGGMVTAELAERFAQAGVQMVTPAAGRIAFVSELLHGSRTDAEVIFGGPLPQMAESSQSVSDAVAYPFLSDPSSFKRKMNGSLEVVLDTDTQRYVFLRDHQLDGQPVMPMAMVLELAAEVAAANWPDMKVAGVADFRMLHGITYPEGATRILRVEASAGSPGLDGTVRLDLAVKSGANTGQLHYRGQVELKRGLPQAPKPSVMQIENGRALPLTVSEAYQLWLFHGPQFAGIEAVEALGDNGIVARLRASSPVGFFEPAAAGDWMIDPVMVDSGLQLLILWARTYLDQTPLPSRLGRYHRYRPATRGEVRCEVAVRHQPGSPLIKADLRFYDEGGVIGSMEEMEVTCSRALNRLARSNAATTVS